MTDVMAISRNRRIIEKIKNIIVEKIHHFKLEVHQRFYELLTDTIPKDYSYLSNFTGLIPSHFKKIGHQR